MRDPAAHDQEALGSCFPLRPAFLPIADLISAIQKFIFLKYYAVDMNLFDQFLTSLSSVVLTLSPFGSNVIPQEALTSVGGSSVPGLNHYLEGPIFRPPGGDDGNPFTCNYTLMGSGWRSCSDAEDRSCWLTNDKGGLFDIKTDYEKLAPVGIQRNYTLVITDESYNADGLDFKEAKLFNKTYPGPWIQACWGDTVQVTVINKMRHNGTSIHWHGIRQNQTMDMDGVNGLTQCPIAPGDNLVYKWKATQYGSTWYHSHYSIQYADGLVGPLVCSLFFLHCNLESSILPMLTYCQTIYGPSSGNYDEAADTPLLMTDWGEFGHIFPLLASAVENILPFPQYLYTEDNIGRRSQQWVRSSL